MRHFSVQDFLGIPVLGLRFENLTSDPTPTGPGHVYYNTVADEYRGYDGTAWVSLVGGGGGPTGAAGGDLSGSYPDPDLADDVVTDANVATGAAIALSKLASDPLARANHTGTQASTTISDFDSAVAAIADAAAAALVDSAPGALDTLNELAQALGDDPNFATTVSDALSALDGRLDTLEAAAAPTHKYATTLSTSASTYNVNHNLNTTDVVVSVWDLAVTGAHVVADVVVTTSNQVQIVFAEAQAANVYRVTVVG